MQPGLTNIVQKPKGSRAAAMVALGASSIGSSLLASRSAWGYVPRLKIKRGESEREGDWGVFRSSL
jgi:hypothetical protein